MKLSPISLRKNMNWMKIGTSKEDEPSPCISHQTHMIYYSLNV